MAELGKTLAEIISRSITDFDSIYDVLSAKGISGFNEAGKSNGSHPTYTYAPAISNYLVGITNGDGLIETDTLALVDEKVVYRTAISPASTTTETAGTTITITSNGISAGYYPANAIITQTITGKALTLTTTNAGSYINTAGDTYHVVAAAGDIMAAVDVAKGSVAPAIKLTPTVESSTEISLGTGGTASATLLTGDTANGFTINVGAASKFSGTVKQTVTPNFTAGYITAFEDTNCKNNAETAIAETVGGTDDKTIVIPDATISGISATATQSLILGTGLVAGTASTGIAVTASIESLEVDSSKINVTAGYIDAGGKNHTGSSAITVDAATKPEDKTAYIKKGSLGTAVTNAGEVTITGTLNTSTTTERDGKLYYDTVVGVDETYSKAIDAGYILNDENTFQANLSGTKTLSIKKGSANVSGTTTINDISSDYTSATETAFAIDVATTTKLAKSVDEGYAKPADVTFTDPSAASKTVYLKEGAVTVASTLTATVHNTDEWHKDDEAAAIFLTSAPATGEYYKINANATANKTAGYVTSGEIASAEGTGNTKYLPKATFTYHAGETTADSFIEVSSGGYLPSGVIKDISEITGTPDYANVYATLSNATVLKSGTTVPDGAYEIALSKNASTNSGYITGTEGEGSLTLDSKYYVPKASAKVSATATNVVLDPSKATAVTEGYQFTVASQNGNVVTTYEQNSAGYQTISDVTGIDLVNHTINTPVGASLTLAKAELSIDTGSTLALAPTTNMVTADTGDTTYKVEVAVDAASSDLVIKTDTAGYLSASDETTITPTVKSSTVYIKSGVAPTEINGKKDATALTGTANDDNSYTVTYAGDTVSVTGAIAEGYYKNLSATGTATVSGTTKTIDAAAGSVNISGTAAITTGMTTVTSVANADDYIAINATANGSVTVAAPTKTGYYKSASQITVTGSVGDAQTKYVKKAPTSVSDIGPSAPVDIETNTNFTYSVSGMIDTYNTSNTTVTLASDAMGSAVQADLVRLRSRLLGTLKTT